MATNLIGRTSRVEWIGLPSAQHAVAARYAAWRGALIAAVGRDVARLFAEPVFSTQAGDPSIGWYTELVGDPQSLSALDEEARRSPEQDLRQALTQLKPFLADTALGPTLASALYVGRRDDILVVGGRPVLINWGHLPPKLSVRDKPGLRRHFRETLGPFAGFAAPDPLARPGAEAADMAASSPGPWRADPSVRRWGLAAGVAALVFVGLGGLPGVLAVPRGVGLKPNVRAEVQAKLTLQRQINETLEQQIAALQAAFDKRGEPAGPVTSALPPAPDETRVKAGAKSLNLVELVDNSVTLILALSEKGDSSGSGFFIDGTHVVTNFHVVNSVVKSGGKLMVFNRKLGVPLEARYVAGTGTSTEDNAIDFAVLEVKPPTVVDALVLSNTGERLQSVVAAGFPGSVTGLDPGLKKLKQGNVAEMPDTNVAQGSIFTRFRYPNGLHLWVHGAPSAPGSSGGPLLDLCGRVIGVHTAGTTRNSDMRAGFAQSSDNLATFLRGVGLAFQQDDQPCEPQRTAAAPHAPAGVSPATVSPGAVR